MKQELKGRLDYPRTSQEIRDSPKPLGETRTRNNWAEEESNVQPGQSSA